MSLGTIQGESAGLYALTPPLAPSSPLAWPIGVERLAKTRGTRGQNSVESAGQLAWNQVAKIDGICTD
jgi:hypothetical protein